MSSPAFVGSVLFGADEMIAAFVAERIAGVDRGLFGERLPDGRLPYAALGVVRGNVLLGGVVYSKYLSYPAGGVIQVSLAFDRADWAYPATLRTLFAYPFLQLGCVRMEASIAARNKRARRFIKGLGFTEEGKHPLRWQGNETAFSYGLLRQDCRFLNRTASNGGQVNPIASAAA